MRRLTAEDDRVLRILLLGPAYELVERPLRSTRECLRLGWAQYGPEYETLVGDRPARARTIHITDAGRAALANSTEGRSE